MKKTIAALVAGAAILASVMPVFAKNPKGPADYNGMNHFGKASHLYLYEKNPTTWEVIEDGAWGKMTYHEDDGTYVFNGHKLETETYYTLVNYYGWPNVNILGSSISDEYGNVHISGNLGDLDEEVEGEGYKVWLVPSSDLTGSALNSWNPSSYLFEYVNI